MDGLSTGQILHGKYRVEKELGSGGMGVVLVATHLRLGQRVAIKLLRPEARGRADITERFAREARAASRLRGEHAVRILDVDDSEAGDPFLVMEYLEGSDLQRVVETRGPLPIPEVIEIALQACEGIAEAHAARIVHRDLKPANLFMTTRPDGSPLLKLLDFGISKIADVETAKDHAITKPDTAIGSPAYMAPEQIKNAGDVDARADIWALGVVLFHMLTADLPFMATTTAALAARIASDPPRDVRELRPDTPPGLAAVITRCLQRERSARFADVAELASALAKLHPDRSSAAARIARVIETGTNKAPSAAEVARIAPATPLPPSGPPTASIHDVAITPGFSKALETEYGSTRSTTSAAPAAPVARSSRTIILAAIAVTVAAASGSFLLLRSGATPAVTPPPSTPVTPTVEPPEAPAPLPIESAAPAASASHAPVVRKPKHAPPPPSASAEKRNPMDIDFR